MRRLDLQWRKKLRNPRRHLRALENWSLSLEGFYPPLESVSDGLWYERIPVFQKVVAPPHTNVAIQKQCAQLMIDAAERLRQARPRGRENDRIYAFMAIPDMFDSFVEVSSKPNPNLFFNWKNYAGRQGDDANWSEHFALSSNRVEDWGLAIPDGFKVLGSGVRLFDRSWMSAPMETEEWAIGELK